MINKFLKLNIREGDPYEDNCNNNDYLGYYIFDITNSPIISIKYLPQYIHIRTVRISLLEINKYKDYN